MHFGTFWGYFGSFWGLFGITLGHFGVTLGHVGVALGSNSLRIGPKSVPSRLISKLNTFPRRIFVSRESANHRKSPQRGKKILGVQFHASESKRLHGMGYTLAKNSIRRGLWPLDAQRHPRRNIFFKSPKGKRRCRIYIYRRRCLYS